MSQQNDDAVRHLQKCCFKKAKINYEILICTFICFHYSVFYLVGFLVCGHFCFVGLLNGQSMKFTIVIIIVLFKML